MLVPPDWVRACTGNWPGVWSHRLRKVRTEPLQPCARSQTRDIFLICPWDPRRTAKSQAVGWQCQGDRAGLARLPVHSSGRTRRLPSAAKPQKSLGHTEEQQGHMDPTTALTCPVLELTSLPTCPVTAVCCRCNGPSTFPVSEHIRECSNQDHGCVAHLHSDGDSSFCLPR